MICVFSPVKNRVRSSIFKCRVWHKYSVISHTHYATVLSRDTIAWIGMVTFIVQTIINSRKISFPNYTSLLDRAGCICILQRTAMENRERIEHREQNYFVEACGKKLTVGPAISARYFDQARSYARLPIVLCAISDGCRGRGGENLPRWECATFEKQLRLHDVRTALPIRWKAPLNRE